MAIRLGLFGGLLFGLLALSAPAHAADDPLDGAAVTYQVPVEAPTGQVQILSLGVADLPAPNLIGSERFVHMRLAAENRHDPRAWLLDARDQFLDLPDGTPLPPRFAEASTGGASAQLVLAPGKRGYLDLFYPVVGGFDPRSTSLTWRVRRGEDSIVARTVFERMPDADLEYGHYRPAQYEGGHLVFGATWCSPWYGSWSDSLRPYWPYRRYRYGHRPGGFAVSSGHSRWNYQRESAPVASDTVGSRWRGGSGGKAIAPPAPASRPSGVASPVPIDLAPIPPAPDRSRWRWRTEHVEMQPTGDGSFSDSARVSGSWSSTDSSPSRPDRSPSPPPSPSPSPSSDSPSTPSSSSPPPSSPPPERSSSDSVGSRWRR